MTIFLEVHTNDTDSDARLRHTSGSARSGTRRRSSHSSRRTSSVRRAIRTLSACVRCSSSPPSPRSRLTSFVCRYAVPSRSLFKMSRSC